MFDKTSYENLLTQMNELSESEFAKFQARIIPNAGKIIGVRMGDLRKIAKKLSKDYYQYRDLCGDAFEERMLLGLSLAYSKIDGEELFDEIRNISKFFRTWAEVDSFCNTMKKKDGLFDLAIELCGDEYAYTVRTGIILLMCLYLDDEHIDRVIEAYKNIDSDEYYVKMGVAWALSTAYTKYPEKIFELLKRRQFDDDTTLKTIRKCIESYRISKEEKDKLRQLRKSLK